MHREALCTLAFVLAMMTAAHGSCPAFGTAEAVERADVVLSGEVVEVHDVQQDQLSVILRQPRKQIVTIRVDRVWKGAVGAAFELILIYRSEGLSSVGQAAQEWQKKIFVVGNKLLVFANVSAFDDKYTVSICSHTKLLSDAEKDIEELR